LLEAQPASSHGLWIKFAEAGSGIASVTKPEAIGAALCHGWIDGQLDKYDDEHWLLRFTPRKARSKWSQVNRTRATELIEAGRMRPSGPAQIEAAKADSRWNAAYAPASKADVPADLQALRASNAERAISIRSITDCRKPACSLVTSASVSPDRSK